MKLKKRFQSIILSAAVVLSIAPRAANAADQTLGGVASEGELRITVTDTGAVQVARHNGSVYEDFWYSGSSVGSKLHYNDGAVRRFVGGSFFSGPSGNFTPVSNTTSGSTVTTVYQIVQGADTITITQTTSYTPGQTFAQVTWVFTNNYGSTLNDLRWFFGGDTYLLGSDAGTGFFSTSTGNGRVGVNKPGATGEFSIEGTTPHHGYDAVHYAVVLTNGNADALTNQVATTVTDIGMAMEWRLASLAAAASWTVQAQISTTMTFNTPTPTPTSTPTPEETPTPAPTVEPGIDPTAVEFEVVANNAPVENALVYLPEAGTCLTSASGRCTIRNLVAGRSYQAHVQKTGVQFTTPSFTVIAGQEASVDGTVQSMNTANCQTQVIAAQLHQAAEGAVSLRNLAADDNSKRADGKSDEPISEAATSATQRVATQLMNYLGASRGVPEVVLSCTRASGCTKTRISAAVRNTHRQLQHLQRESLLANRILRSEQDRTEARARRRAQLIRETGSRASRILNKLPRFTWTCPQPQ
jgi:hypothetical protein